MVGLGGVCIAFGVASFEPETLPHGVGIGVRIEPSVRLGPNIVPLLRGLFRAAQISVALDHVIHHGLDTSPRLFVVHNVRRWKRRLAELLPVLTVEPHVHETPCLGANHGGGRREGWIVPRRRAGDEALDGRLDVTSFVRPDSFEIHPERVFTRVRLKRRIGSE